MNMFLEVRTEEGDPKDWTRAVLEGMQAEFERQKAVNPHGYMDAFESRLDLWCAEFARANGGRFNEARCPDEGKCLLIFGFPAHMPVEPRRHTFEQAKV